MISVTCCFGSPLDRAEDPPEHRDDLDVVLGQVLGLGRDTELGEIGLLADLRQDSLLALLGLLQLGVVMAVAVVLKGEADRLHDLRRRPAHVEEHVDFLILDLGRDLGHGLGVDGEEADQLGNERLRVADEGVPDQSGVTERRDDDIGPESLPDQRAGVVGIRAENDRIDGLEDGDQGAEDALVVVDDEESLRLFLGGLDGHAEIPCGECGGISNLNPLGRPRDEIPFGGDD